MPRKWKLYYQLKSIITVLMFACLFLGAVTNIAPGQDEKGAPEEAAPAAEEPTATLIFNNGKIAQVLMQLKAQTGVNVMTQGKASDVRVDIIAQKEPVSVILQKIANKSNLRIIKNDDMNYILMDEKTYISKHLPKQVIRKIFVLKYIKAEDARKALQNVVTKNIGQIAADPRTNKLIVTDLPQVIELIKRLLDEIDVQLMTRVFYIRHADVSDLANMLKNYKSNPGTIETDPKTHQIIVTDIFQNIKRMEMLIQILDVGPEMRIYDLNNIGAEGKGSQQLAKAIEEVITKNADVFWQIDERTGILLVQDVPEVHERIEKVLAAFDKPIKQVLIYSELMDTNFSKNYDYGIEWDASEDLFSAELDNLFGDGFPNGTSGDMSTNLGFRNLSEEFPIFMMDGSGIGMSYLNKYVRASLRAALTKSDTKILLQPRLIVKNMEKAKITVGGSKPYRTTNYYSGNNEWQSSGQSSVPYGLEVTLEPTITNTGLVEMTVTFSNSNATFVGDPTDNPLVEKTETRVETTLIIPDGETRVLAGLLNNNDAILKEGIPFLSEIPIIGSALFGSHSDQMSRRNILFFITPTIIETKANREQTYRGRSLDDIINEGKEIPEFLLDLTSPTLSLETPDESMLEMTEGPGLLSSMPVELPKLLGEGSSLDARTLRQERESVMSGPSGSFSASVGSAPFAPPKKVARNEKDDDEKERRVEEKISTKEDEEGERPRRPVRRSETNYK